MSDGTISRYLSKGDTPATTNSSLTRRERRVIEEQQRAKEQGRRERRAAINDEVETAEDLTDGVYQVYDHAMEGMDELDFKRVQLAGNDQAKNMLYGRMQMKAARKIDRIVDGLFDA